MKKFLFIGYPVLELCTAVAFIIWLGFGWTIVIYVVGIPIGWLILKSAGRKSLELAKEQQTPSRALSFRFVAGVLFLIPGFWTDLCALLCFVPFIQAKIAAPFSFLTSNSNGVNWRVSSWNTGGDIVEGVVIHENDDPNTQNFLGSRD